MKNVLSTIIALIILSRSTCFAEGTEQVKIFTGYNYGNADAASTEVQKKVNEWLKMNKNMIIVHRYSSVTGGGSGSGTFVVNVTIFYKK